MTATTLRIGPHLVGDGRPTFVIAEAGLNHNGSRAEALALVDAAAAAGAQAVKFQRRDLRASYRTEILDDASRAEQGLQYVIPHLRAAALGDDALRAAADRCAAHGLTFLCSAWDAPSLAAVRALGVPALKVSSADLTNAPLLDEMVATRLPLLVSTGMASEEEIRAAIAQLDAGGAEYLLLHCVSTYPATADELNLRFLRTLRDWSGRPVGYSGHELGIAATVAAVALGACVVERHLTRDRAAAGPDHRASLEPAEFGALVAAIREVDAALGAPHRWITRGELLNRRTLAKSVVATRDLAAGQVLARGDLAAKGPGLGISPQRIGALVGRTLARAVAADAALAEDDLAAAPIADVTPLDVGAPWGIVVRAADEAALVARFAPRGLRFVELHLTDRDLQAGPGALDPTHRGYGLVVHAPEYRGQALVDLCDADDAARAASVAQVQAAIDFARGVAARFTLDPALFPRGPKVVVHAGGMSREAADPGPPARDRLAASVRALDASGVDLLLENLPPQPWYFGGRWHGHVLCGAADVVHCCTTLGVGLCLDLSHAALACAHDGTTLDAFLDATAPIARHLHVSDAAGTAGEGLPIGDGTVNFARAWPRLAATGATVVPEIWMGHHDGGDGFAMALESLADVHWAARALARPARPDALGSLESLVVHPGTSILATLRTIDANRMGIAFVADADRRVLGVVTDGDIRHAIVRGVPMHAAVTEAMTTDFVRGAPGDTREALRARLPGRTRVMPIVDAEGRLVDVANLWTVGDAAR